MRLGLLGRDEPFAHQQLDVAVIPRARGRAMADVIYAAIADMHPPRGGALHEADRARCARTLLQRQMQADFHHFLVRTPEREMQEAQGIEQGMRRMPERFEKHLQRDFRGLSAIRVTAHAVHHHKQARVLRDGRRHPILIIFPVAEKTDVGVFDLQEETRASVRLCRLYITLTLAA